MTCSAVDASELARVRRQLMLALLTALAIGVHAAEALLPTPLPWFRLGLANILTVVTLCLFGGRAAWALTLSRIGLGALLLGRLFSPGFWLALAGGILATTVMVCAWQLGRKHLGPVGISVLGAAGHALGQLAAARLLLVQHAGIWQLFPVFLLFAVCAGTLTGWLAASLLVQLREHPVFKEDVAIQRQE